MKVIGGFFFWGETRPIRPLRPLGVEGHSSEAGQEREKGK